jgi:hypothetical protein
VGAQEHRLAVTGAGIAAHVDVEGIVHVHRGVIGREVERLEVVPLRLGLGPYRPVEAEAVAVLADLLHHAGDRVDGADPAAPTGERGVESRAGLAAPLPGELGVARVERRLERNPELVRRGTDSLPVVGW